MSHLLLFPQLRPKLTSDFAPCRSDTPSQPRRLRLLVAASGPRDAAWAQALVVRLSNDPYIEMRAIVDDVVPRLTQNIMVLRNRNLAYMVPSEGSEAINFAKRQAFELTEWADLLVCVPLDADGIAKMLAGVVDSVLSEVLRGWNPQKAIVIAPGMSITMWENPLTQRHLDKIQRKWTWVRLVSPITWRYAEEPGFKKSVTWKGFNDVVKIVYTYARQFETSQRVDYEAAMTPLSPFSTGVVVRGSLPPEIWAQILEHLGDWELSKALGLYANLPVPPEWSVPCPNDADALAVYRHALDWTALTSNETKICRKLSDSPPDFREMPPRTIKLIIRFGLTDVLCYLEMNRPDLFKAFDKEVLPRLASVDYPQIRVLDYWSQSDWFKTSRTYGKDIVDAASGRGNIEVLNWWWRQSGLPLRYSEISLELATRTRNFAVLEWWREAAAQDESIVVRPGRSLMYAAESGRVDVLVWWAKSGFPLPHESHVVRIASYYGRIDVLETWRRLRGHHFLDFLDRMALMNATSQKHLHVLEWWRKLSHGELDGMQGEGLTVWYRTCDIMEALDDRGDTTRVRAWWIEHGLNVGLSPQARQIKRKL